MIRSQTATIPTTPAVAPRVQKLPADFRLAVLAEKAWKLCLKTNNRRYHDKAILFYDLAQTAAEKAGDQGATKIFRGKSSRLRDIRKETRPRNMA